MDPQTAAVCRFGFWARGRLVGPSWAPCLSILPGNVWPEGFFVILG